MNGVFLGVDLGTSSVKVVAIGTTGDLLAASRVAYPTARPELGAAEQDPSAWWAATRAALFEIGESVAPSSWAGIGLSGMLPTLVELDDSLNAVGMAVTWEDGRAEQDSTALRQGSDEARTYKVTGQRVDAHYLAPMHTRRVRLGTAGKTVASAKDWLFLQLTGELLTDPSTATGYGTFDLTRRRWDPSLLAAAGLADVPAVKPSTETRALLPALAREFGCRQTLPIILGAADSVLGALGLKTGPHDIAVISGSSTVVLGRSEQVVLDPRRRFLVTPMATDDFGLEMDLLATGSAVAWLTELLHFDGPDALVAAAAAVDPIDAPTFLPYVAPGEQGALWDSSLTGLIHGVHLGTTPAHLARGLITGIVLELARCISVLGESTHASGAIRLGGRGSLTGLLQHDLQNATGRQVVVSPNTDHSALGAAMLSALVVSGVGLPPTEPSPPRRGNDAIAPQWSRLAALHETSLLAHGAIHPQATS